MKIKIKVYKYNKMYKKSILSVEGVLKTAIRSNNKSREFPQ